MPPGPSAKGWRPPRLALRSRAERRGVRLPPVPCRGQPLSERFEQRAYAVQYPLDRSGRRLHPSQIRARLDRACERTDHLRRAWQGSDSLPVISTADARPRPSFVIFKFGGLIP